MNATPAERRTVTLRSSSGRVLLTVPVLPAALAAAASVALAPRATALAAIGALLRGMSLTLGAASVSPPAS
ncbi:MAG: hypothetical protein JW785_11920 [Acidimicrobiia bacterium]|nr:hypothetical protein [Acidimicrobiia bacterium]